MAERMELCSSFQPVVSGIEFPPGSKAFLEKTGSPCKRLCALGTQAAININFHLKKRNRREIINEGKES